MPNPHLVHSAAPGVEGSATICTLSSPAQFADDMRRFDVVVSSNHCVAKGMRLHISLPCCFLLLFPMRSLLGTIMTTTSAQDRPDYSHSSDPIRARFLRRSDVRTAAQPHTSSDLREHATAVSNISTTTTTSSMPPVETSALSLSRSNDGFFLMVSTLVPYKR